MNPLTIIAHETGSERPLSLSHKAPIIPIASEAALHVPATEAINDLPALLRASSRVSLSAVFRSHVHR